MRSDHITLTCTGLLALAILLPGCASIVSTNPAQREQAAARLSDQKVLLQVALYDGSLPVRKAALKHLTNQNSLVKFIGFEQDHALRKMAFANLTDPAALEKLASTSSDAAVRLVAEVRMGKKVWRQLFASAPQAGVELGDLLGAISLVERQADVAAAVTRACHHYITQGDSARIPELKELLKLYGDKPLAEDYLNCGQPQLADAGREWASAHGLTVRTGMGSNRVRWGGRK
jgi:hypothetical protein